MKVLLTGATGFLGSEIARELVRQGHQLRALVRKTSKLDGLAGLDFERFEGDILDRASIDRALVGVDALIHTAGCVGNRRRDKEAVYRVNVEGARTVLAAAQARGGLRVVHTSSVAAIGATRDPGLHTEESPWTIGGMGCHYIDSKRQGEEVALEFAKQGLDLVVMNPGVIFGPGDVYFTSTRMALEYMKGSFRFFPSGGITACDVREVAKAHVAGLTRGKAGERYILAGQNMTYRELLAHLRSITGLGRARRLPFAIAWLAALFSETVSLVKEHSLEEVNRPNMRFSRLYNFCDASKATRELGYRVPPAEETLRDTVKDFLARGIFPAKTPELQALAIVARADAAPQPALAGA